MDRERGISFPKLLELVRAGNRDEDVLVTLAARLDRMDRQLTDPQRETVEAASGGVPLRTLVAGIIVSTLLTVLVSRPPPGHSWPTSRRAASSPGCGWRGGLGFWAGHR